MQGTRDQSWTVGMLRAAARSRRQEPWLWRVSTDKLSPSYWGGWRRTCCQVGEQLIKTFYIIQFYLGIILIPTLRFRCIFLNFSSITKHLRLVLKSLLRFIETLSKCLFELLAWDLNSVYFKISLFLQNKFLSKWINNNEDKNTNGEADAKS